VINPLVRVYFNKRGGLPWSVDTGSGTEEFQTGAVNIRCHSQTVYDTKAGDDENTPTAWLEIRDAGISKVIQGRTASEYDFIFIESG